MSGLWLFLGTEAPAMMPPGVVLFFFAFQKAVNMRSSHVLLAVCLFQPSYYVYVSLAGQTIQIGLSSIGDYHIH